MSRNVAFIMLEVCRLVFHHGHRAALSSSLRRWDGAQVVLHVH
jgi:hypothetical protein